MPENKFDQAFEAARARKGLPEDDIPGQLPLVGEILLKEALLPKPTVDNVMREMRMAVQGQLVERQILKMGLNAEVLEFLRTRAAQIKRWYKAPEII